MNIRTHPTNVNLYIALDDSLMFCEVGLKDRRAEGLLVLSGDQINSISASLHCNRNKFVGTQVSISTIVLVVALFFEYLTPAKNGCNGQRSTPHRLP